MRTSVSDRYEIYTKILGFMLDMKLCELPTPLEYICGRIGIELYPLSKIISGMGLTQWEIFQIWRNENGHLMPCLQSNGLYKFKIAFNDSINHKERKRFTIAEELAHYILGHYKEPMYSIFDPSPWDDWTYQMHEESARIGAGILVCPPPIFYEAPSLHNVADIKFLCDISEPCANTRNDILKRYREEVESHHLYSALLEQYDPYIASLPCPICGGVLFKRDGGICYDCASDIMGYKGHCNYYLDEVIPWQV